MRAGSLLPFVDAEYASQPYLAPEASGQELWLGPRLGRQRRRASLGDAETLTKARGQCRSSLVMLPQVENIANEADSTGA